MRDKSWERATVYDDVVARLRSTDVLRPTAGSDLDPPPDPEGRTLAGVLILLYPRAHVRFGERTSHLVLTRRTEHLPRHQGQISLPGGRYDPGDRSLLRTALRETREEVGVDEASITVLGQLEPETILASHYVITPFVACASARPSFQPAGGEVAELIELPLPVLLDPDALGQEVWEIRGIQRRVSFYRYGEHKIWGATARVLSKLVRVLDPRYAPPVHATLEPGGVFPESARSER